MKPIRLSGHAYDQLARRGVLQGEIIFAIQNASWQNAEGLNVLTISRLPVPGMAVIIKPSVCGQSLSKKQKKSLWLPFTVTIFNGRGIDENHL